MSYKTNDWNVRFVHFRENQFFLAYKQAKRRDDDIAIVNAAFNLTIANDKVER